MKHIDYGYTDSDAARISAKFGLDILVIYLALNAAVV